MRYGKRGRLLRNRFRPSRVREGCTRHSFVRYSWLLRHDLSSVREIAPAKDWTRIFTFPESASVPERLRRVEDVACEFVTLTSVLTFWRSSTGESDFRKAAHKVRRLVHVHR